MIQHPEIWSIIKGHLPKGVWVELSEIYAIVEQYGSLDSEDFLPQSPSSNLPKWKRNVRNVLQHRKKAEEIEWGGEARYLIS